MKQFIKRSASVLLAAIMLVSVLSASVTAVITEQYLTLADSEASASGKGESPEIDYDYSSRISDPEAAQTAIINSKTTNANANQAAFTQAASGYKWKRISRPDFFYNDRDQNYNNWMKNVKESTTPTWSRWYKYENVVGYHVNTDYNPLKQCLESADPSNKYLILDSDFDYENLYYVPDTIKITSDKVLDLNGHSIYLNDISNRKFRGAKQNDHAFAHMSYMFDISKGATLTIIDSSELRNGEGKGSGAIYTNNYMCDPFGYPYEYYTSRDIFWVSGGNLVIYGGYFQAGRCKDQRQATCTWGEIKKVAGSAVDLGINIAEYAYGIKAAKAGLDDLNESFKNQSGTSAEPSGAPGERPASEGGSTVQKDGSNGVNETKKDTPDGEQKRIQTVAEKAGEVNKAIEKDNQDNGTQKPTEPDNNANGKQNAKGENQQGKSVDGKNVKLVEAEKKITDAALDKSKLSEMASGAFELVDSIIDCFKSNGPHLTQSTLGTVVKVGNNGTFVSYGGTYVGFGSTANTRNAVVEVVEQVGVNNTQIGEEYGKKFKGGLAYIYGGDFQARAGANIFNIVGVNQSGGISGVTYQTYRDYDGSLKKEAAAIHDSEIYGGRPITTYTVTQNGKTETLPVNTKNITIRGGNYNCSAELSMAGLWSEGKITMFPGTPGYMNLGPESYGDDFIKDGRIQIRDTYGDGELVLMDEARDENEQLHHYRLFCSELELRYKQHIQVYPGNPEANTTHSFRLVSTNTDASEELVDLARSWSDDENGTVRSSAYADTEQYFEYPVNTTKDDGTGTSGAFYIIPTTKAQSTDVYGDKLQSSSMWYYATPLKPDGKQLNTSFNYTDLYRLYKVNINGAFSDILYSERGDAPHYYIYNGTTVSDSRYQLLNQESYSNNYLSNLKWFRYKVYRVDPLTRENIDEGNHYGDDVPLADIVYGADDNGDSLKCKLTLKKLEKYLKDKWGNKKDRYGNYHFQGFKPGEMYRVVFSVEESVKYNYNGVSETFNHSLEKAAMNSSILFTCFEEEIERKTNPKNPKGSTIPDFTPLQWDVQPEAGKTAKVTIKNGKGAQTDYLGRKIFDLYYQWYTVDEDGKETMIAGTTDIYTGGSSKELKDHSIAGINKATANKTGDKYINSLTPAQKASGLYDEFGMNKDTRWNCVDFHAYSHWFLNDDQREEIYFGGSGSDGLEDNYPYIFNTGSDSCYIPKEAAGKTVYCKVYAVNTYWPLNYDHVQVYKTRKIELPRNDCKVVIEGRGGYDSYTVPIGGKFTLPEGFEDPTIGSTKEFDRWTLGKPGDVITVKTDIRINAVWKESQSSRVPTVKFDADEGTGAKPDETFSNFGITYKLPECTFTPPAGKAFDHWYVAQLDRSYVGDFHPGDTFKLTKSVIVRAEYSSRFDVYGAIAQGDKSEKWFKTVTIGSEYTLPEIPEDFEKYGENYADSWNLGKPGDKITITANMVKSDGVIWLIPAYRDEKEYKVTYDANGGTFKEEFGGGSTYVVGVMELDSKSDQRIITDDTLYRDGYEFLGWKIVGSDKLLAPAEKFKVTGDVTIKAQWKEIPAPAPNWHSEFDRSTGTLTVVGTGIISQTDGSYMTGISDDVDFDDLKHLVFSEGITEINKVFSRQNSFETVSFPSTLEKIGPHVFDLTGAGLRYVEEIDIPANCKTIGAYAFGDNIFTKVTLHEGLEAIGKHAFDGCDRLKEITIPSSVKKIGRFALGSEGERYFCDTQELIDGIIASKSDKFIEDFKLHVTKGSAAEEYAIKFGFNYDNGEAKPTPVTNDKIGYTVDKAAGTITITGTGAIPDYNYYNAPWAKAKADYDCHKLIISEGITSIGKYAFAGMCLLEVQFPSTLKKIDDYAFIGCDLLGAMDGITFPDKLQSIGTSAFRFVGAKTINFGKGVKSIGDYAFCDRYVYNLEIGTTIAGEQYYHTVPGSHYAYEVEIPDNVKTIGDYAFGYYNTYEFNWAVAPYSLEAPLSNLGGKDQNGKVKTLTIVTPKGSAAYKYAKANGFKTSTKGVVNYLCVGDVNYDGLVNDRDLKRFDDYFVSYLVLEIPQYNLKEETADINGDGVINETDYNLLQSCLENSEDYKTYIKPIRVIK